LLQWLLDEHIARSTVEMLRDLGYDVKWIVEEGLQGADDEVLYQLAVAEQCVILTLDSDFGQMVCIRSDRLAGALILNFKPRNTEECNKRLRGVLERVGDPTDRLIIVSRYRIRVRPFSAE